MNHRHTHPTPVDSCWACKVMTVGFSAAAMPTRYPEPVRIDNADRQLAQDRDAYKRLRHDGLQPRQINGSAEAEQRVSGQFDFDLGRYVPRSEENHVREAMEWGKELFQDHGADSLARPL